MLSKQKRFNVLISVPNTGWVHKSVIFALLKLQRDVRFNTSIILPTWNPYEHNLNRIAKDFIAQEFDYWLNIDSDNPPTKNPLDLIILDLDVIGLPTPQCHTTGKDGERPFYWVAVDKVGDAYKEHVVKDGIQEVDAVGSGCMLIARRVLLGMKHPFQRVYDKDGLVVKGVDFNFCDRAKALGFRIFAHYGYPCQHYKELEMIEMIQAFSEVKHG